MRTLLLFLQVVTQRLMKLQTKGSPVHLPAEVIIRRRKRVKAAGGGSSDQWEMVRARGHLDEVEELKAAGSTPSALNSHWTLCTVLLAFSYQILRRFDRITDL